MVAEISHQIDSQPAATTAEIRAIRWAFSKRLIEAPPKFVVNLALELLCRRDFTYRFVAYELIHYNQRALSSLRIKDLLALGVGLNSWVSVDTFASYLSGPAWRERQISDAEIHSWAHSPDRWWRRAALVSTVPLNNKTRGGSGDRDRTLAVCALLIDDRDDMVVKAMSWALRELSKRDSSAADEFLRHNEKKLASRVLREVRHKLTNGVKNPRKT